MGLLEGRQGLIFGIANHRSYAWHIAQALISEGAGCAFTSLPDERMQERLHDAVAKLDVKDPWVALCDAGKDEDLDRVFSSYADSFERLDFVVHSIAFADKTYLAPGNFVDTPRKEFLQAIDISAYTLVGMAQRARAQMAKGGGGSILSMSYYGAEKVVPGYNVMGVAKATLECSTRYLASDLGADKIRVNAISGGPLRTLAASGIAGFTSILKGVPERAPLRRNVEGSDVGGAAVYLLSDLSSGVTGETLHVDCGFSVSAM